MERCDVCVDARRNFPFSIRGCVDFQVVGKKNPEIIPIIL
jgi:hypothetical protein